MDGSHSPWRKRKRSPCQSRGSPGCDCNTAASSAMRPLMANSFRTRRNQNSMNLRSLVTVVFWLEPRPAALEVDAAEFLVGLREVNDALDQADDANDYNRKTGEHADDADD